MTPILQSLHWLPVSERIEYKICLLVYKCLNGIGPAYLADMLKPVANLSLRSSTIKSDLQIPFKIKPTYGNRAFSICGPTLWNKLPVSVRASLSLETFKKNLKTHLFKRCYKV